MLRFVYELCGNSQSELGEHHHIDIEGNAQGRGKSWHRKIPMRNAVEGRKLNMKGDTVIVRLE